MNLSGVYDKFTDRQARVIQRAWMSHRGLALNISILPFVDIEAAIGSLEIYVLRLSYLDDTKERQQATHLIDQLVVVWHTKRNELWSPKGKLQKARKKWKRKKNRLLNM